MNAILKPVKFKKMQPKHNLLIITKTHTVACIIVLFLGSSCKKFLNVDAPNNQVTEISVYNNDNFAASVITGIYKNISNNAPNYDMGINAIFLYTGLSGDELVPFNPTEEPYSRYYLNMLSGQKNDPQGTLAWASIYNNIFTINSLLEGVANSSGLTPGVKQQLLGEARFMRAFCYFYLINLYGAAPLITSTDYKQNGQLPRAAVDLVYTQIIEDLHEAQNLLNINYLDGSLLKPTSERLRPTRMAATALLSRVYLYAGNWIGADSAATALIENKSLFNLTDLDGVFLNNSEEAIWQLQNIWDSKGTVIAETFIPTVSGNQISTPVYLSSQLMNSFETGDQRRIKWINSVTAADGTVYPYAFKYKVHSDGSAAVPQTERLTVLRLAEQYLVRANARLKLGNLTGARDDLNQIRNRAGLLNVVADDEPALLKAIIHERQHELFTEWGDRWFELKRTRQIDEVMTIVCPQKGNTWNTNWQLYPLPYEDLIADKKLTQNEGY